MRLMTQTLEKRFAQVGSQREESDPLIIAHYFNPTGAGDWYATEYDPGYTSLDELEAFKGQFGLGIERDLYWHEKRASEVISKGK
jgi:hypothetical protein